MADHSHVRKIVARGRRVNRRIQRNVVRLAEVQRTLAHKRKLAAKREGEIMAEIKAERVPNSNQPAYAKEDRERELAVRVITDPERSSLEAEIAGLTVRRERYAAALETSRNELKLLLLEGRDATREAGEPMYQPEE
jgi:hypothetical protein